MVLSGRFCLPCTPLGSLLFSMFVPYCAQYVRTLLCPVCPIVALSPSSRSIVPLSQPPLTQPPSSLKGPHFPPSVLKPPPPPPCTNNPHHHHHHHHCQRYFFTNNTPLPENPRNRISIMCHHSTHQHACGHIAPVPATPCARHLFQAMYTTRVSSPAGCRDRTAGVVRVEGKCGGCVRKEKEAGSEEGKGGV